MQTNSNYKRLCESIQTNLSALIDTSTKKVFEAFPEIFEKYGAGGVERTKEDIGFHFNYLKSAVCLDDKQLFLDYVEWLKMFFTSINLPIEYQKLPLQHIKEACTEILKPEESALVNEYVDHALEKFDDMPTESNSFITHDNELNVLAHQYLNTLLRKDRLGAERLILEKVNSGVSIRDIYLNVFQPTQWEIGRLWQSNQITVAMEHFCTAATQFIMSRLYEYIFSTNKIGKNLVATSVSGELHEMGIRMVSDFFELEGWNTYYLGSNTPHNSIIDMVKDTNSELLAISSTIPFNVPKVQELISAVRKVIPKEELKILVGGRPFNTNNELWKTVGADAFALDAQSAIKLGNQLVGLN